MSFQTQTGFQSTPPRTGKSSLLAKHGKPAHKRTARVLGYALTLNDATGWQALTQTFSKHLSERECAGVALMALIALPDATAALVVEKCSNGAGPPLPPLLGHMDEAAHWADMATPNELDAYALASIKRMTPARKAEFINHIVSENNHG